MSEAIEYISVIDASNKWGISPKRIQVLCSQDRIEGAARIGRTWAIPQDAKKPADMRYKSNILKVESTNALQEKFNTLSSHKALKHCTLFEQYSDKELSDALLFFDAEEKCYKKDDHLLMIGERWSRFGLVLSGAVTVSMDDISGNRIIMANVSPGITFGESMCFLDVAESPVNITAGDDTHVLWLSLDNIKSSRVHLTSVKAYELTLRFVSMLAKRTLDMNDRIQILSKRTLHDKLITFFTHHMRLVGSHKFTVNMSREDMASYLGADRSALSRELSHMKKDGAITYKKNNFEILVANLLE